MVTCKTSLGVLQTAIMKIVIEDERQYERRGNGPVDFVCGYAAVELVLRVVLLSMMEWNAVGEN